MLIGQGAPATEEWRRCAKAIMGGEGDHEQVRNPFTVLHVGLAALHALDMMSVDQEESELDFQQIGHWLADRVGLRRARQGDRPMAYWWLSFADTSRPSGSQNLGVAIVEARDLESAVAEAWRLKCNPGGEFMGIQLSEVPEGLPTGRLLTPEEIDAHGTRITIDRGGRSDLEPD
jgi:hypothetical protein